MVNVQISPYLSLSKLTRKVRWPCNLLQQVGECVYLFLLLLSFVPVWSPCFRSYVCPFEAVVTLILPLHDLSQGFTRLVLELESRASRLRNCGVGRPLLSHPCHKVDSAFSRGGCGFSSAPSVIRDHLFLDRARLVQALFPLIWFAF